MNRKILLFSLAGLIILLTGIYIGYQSGLKQYQVMQLQYDESTAINLETNIRLLTHLRNGEIAESVRMLEYLTDNNIQYLYGRLKTEGHAQQVDREIIEAIRQAKAYRGKYPRHKPGKDISGNIDKIFQEVND